MSIVHKIFVQNRQIFTYFVLNYGHIIFGGHGLTYLYYVKLTQKFE